MKHLFVPYELAKQLKEEGFNEPCLAFYNFRNELHINDDKTDYDWSQTQSECEEHRNGILAPLYQQVVDWFREKHKIFIQISLSTPYDLELTIYGEGKEKLYRTFEFAIEDYYEALTKAIEEALKLI